MIELLRQIWCALLQVICAIQNSGIAVINVVIRAVAAACNEMLSKLPQAAMPDVELDGGLIAAANYIFPLYECALVVSAIMTAWMIWKAIAYFLRFWLPV